MKEVRIEVVIFLILLLVSVGLFYIFPPLGIVGFIGSLGYWALWGRED